MIKPKPEQIKAWVEANFQAKSRKNGRELVICNPFDGDTGYHLNISTEKATCHDWRGDSWSGDYHPTFFRLVQLFRGCSFAQAVKEVCGKDVTIDSIMNRIRERDKPKATVSAYSDIKLPEGSQPIIGSTQPKMAAMLIGWLESRGLTSDDIKQYNLHHAGADVIWPYYEYDELVYWQSRNRINKIFRFPPESVGVTKGMFLYGFDMVEPSYYAILTEAIFGAHTIRAQCLASGGAVLTDMQLRKLRALNPVKGVILAPDNDKAGQQSITHNYYLIQPYFPVFYSIPPKIEFIENGEHKFSKDWNEIGQICGFNKVRKIFEERVKPANMSDIVVFSTGQAPIT